MPKELKKLPFLYLSRFSSTSKNTLGFLKIEDDLFFTLELPWKNNAKRASCIPQGLYEIEKYTTQKFGETFHIMDIPNRDGVVFHWGNTEKDSLGCILIGNALDVENRKIVPFSRVAFSRFMKRLESIDKAELMIVDLWRYIPEEKDEG